METRIIFNSNLFLKYTTIFCTFIRIQFVATLIPCLYDIWFGNAYPMIHNARGVLFLWTSFSSKLLYWISDLESLYSAHQHHATTPLAIEKCRIVERIATLLFIYTLVIVSAVLTPLWCLLTDQTPTLNTILTMPITPNQVIIYCLLFWQLFVHGSIRKLLYMLKIY